MDGIAKTVAIGTSVAGVVDMVDYSDETESSRADDGNIDVNVTGEQFLHCLLIAMANPFI